jgi:hypothetical protein
MAETTTGHFFVIEENIKLPSANIYAEGTGREILQPLARLALLQKSNEEYDYCPLEDSDFPYVDNLYDKIRLELRKDDPKPPLRVESEELASILHVGQTCSLFSDVVRSYRKKVFEQARSGHPLDEAHQTLTQLHADVTTVRSVAEQWFDKNGIRIKSPIERSYEGITGQFAPRLRKLDRRSAGHLLGKERKEEYFKAIPRGAKPCSIEQINLHKYKDGAIRIRQPLERSGLTPQTIYGYIDPKTGEFKDLFQV